MCDQKSPSPRACHVSGSSAVRSRPYVHETAASASSRVAETRSRVPSAKAPPPRLPHQRRPSAGAETTPQPKSPSRSSAISVAQIGTPRVKLRVPSIGSTIQRALALSRSPYSSPSTPSPGRSRAMRSRSSSSVARSASVTGVASAFVSTTNCREWKRGSVSASAASASSSAKRRSASTRRRYALRKDFELRLLRRRRGDDLEARRRDDELLRIRPAHLLHTGRQVEVDPADAVVPGSARDRQHGRRVEREEAAHRRPWIDLGLERIERLRVLHLVEVGVERRRPRDQR